MTTFYTTETIAEMLAESDRDLCSMSICHCHYDKPLLAAIVRQLLAEREAARTELETAQAEIARLKERLSPWTGNEP